MGRHRESEPINDGSRDSSQEAAAAMQRPHCGCSGEALAAEGWCGPTLASTGHVPDSSLHPWLGDAPVTSRGAAPSPASLLGTGRIHLSHW